MFPRKRHIKTVSALLFFSIFLLIHAEKAFHTHPVELKSSSSHTTLVDHFSATCSICEFQLAKDAALPDLPVASQAKVIDAEPFIAIRVDLLSRDFHSTPGRGPPSLL